VFLIECNLDVQPGLCNLKHVCVYNLSTFCLILSIKIPEIKNYIQTLVLKSFCYVIRSLINKLLAVLYLSADVCIVLSVRSREVTLYPYSEPFSFFTL